MKKTVSILFSVMIIISCNKKLDVSPSDAIPEGDVFTNSTTIEKALNGAYDIMTGDYLLNGDLQLYSELLGANGEIRWSGTYTQPREIENKKILINNSWVAETWTQAYAAINVCNNIIASIAVVDEADRDRVKGEALFIRGEMYFELVELFAKPYSAGNVDANLGVQLVTTPTQGNVTEANYVPRSTVAEIYNQIVADLNEAKNLLPDDNGIYANKFAAAAVLSRVYLQMLDYTKARDEADFVIENSSYSLTSTYAEAFDNEENSSEDIFAVQISEQDGSNDMHLFWSILDYGARDGDVDVLQKHINLYDAADERRQLFYEDGDVWRSGKWKLQFRNIPLIRLAEMYLTRAECNFRLGTSVGATPFKDIQTIRSRAGLSTTSSYITLDNIIKERHLELAHEGQRIHDIKRVKQSVDGYQYDADELVFPIPIQEINTVGADILQQNDGY
ncbi:MAG TPA: RagB/SusD family nutrient uptake outer membrane protein [Chitinophagaceae bacterium]|jgi:hypothetical protein